MNKRVWMSFLTIVMVALGVFMAPTSTVGAQDEPVRTCTQSDLDYDVVLNWAIEAVVATTETVTTVFLGFIVVDLDVHVTYEYYNAAGELVLWNGTFKLTDTCTPEFLAATSDWNCPTTMTQTSHSVELANGNDVLIVPLSFDAWQETIGWQLVEHHTETEILAMYYEYTLTFEATVTTSNTRCTPPAWRPGLTEVMLYMLPDMSYGDQLVTYSWLDGNGVWQPIRASQVGFGGNISLLLEPGDYVPQQYLETYIMTETDEPFFPAGLYIAQLNGEEILRVVVAEDLIGGMPRPFVVSYRADMLPRPDANIAYARKQ